MASSHAQQFVTEPCLAIEFTGGPGRVEPYFKRMQFDVIYKYQALEAASRTGAQSTRRPCPSFLALFFSDLFASTLAGKRLLNTRPLAGF